MDRRILALIFTGIAGLAACGGGGGSGSFSPPSGGGGGGGAPPPTGVAAKTIGIALPSGTIGTVNSSFGMVGGYTQSTYSQVLAFPPGTTVKLKNLSSNTPHTLNVISTSGFPSNASLSTTASGGSDLKAGFASGAIPAGGTMSVTLNTPGTYFIGCAFHYSVGMRDVLMVSDGATPGPQATPQPSGSSGGGCTGVYC